jgi:hypothetical protein
MRRNSKETWMEFAKMLRPVAMNSGEHECLQEAIILSLKKPDCDTATELKQLGPQDEETGTKFVMSGSQLMKVIHVSKYGNTHWHVEKAATLLCWIQQNIKFVYDALPCWKRGLDIRLQKMIKIKTEFKKASDACNAITDDLIAFAEKKKHTGIVDRDLSDGESDSDNGE